MRLVVDSNIFISSLDPNDTFHDDCYPVFEKIVNLEIEALCPVLVLVETACVMRRRTNNEDATRDVYRSLSSLPSINWFDITLAVAERACLLGAKTGLKGGDAIVLQVAEEYGIPILTKDKEVKRKAPAGIIVFEPEDLSL